LLHRRTDSSFVITWVAGAFVRHANPSKPDRKLVTVCRFTRLADCHHDATPVGIFACNSRFHERRIGDRHGDTAGRDVSDPPPPPHPRPPASALPVTRNLFPEVLQHARQRVFLPL